MTTRAAIKRAERAKMAERDLLNAYQIMEHTLGALLLVKAKRVAALAKDLTRRHAIKKRKAKKRSWP